MQAPFNPNQLELTLEEPVLKLSGKMAVPDLEKQAAIQLSQFKLYCGDYWVKFPQSE